MSQENSKLGNEWKENDLRCRHLWEAKSENHRRCKRCGLNQLLKNIQQKCDTMQNFRLAIRMCDEQGWIARNCLIWHKPNVMPSSVKDRFTVDYEPVFFFTKSKKYWFEQQFEPQQTEPFEPRLSQHKAWDNDPTLERGKGENSIMKFNPLGRTKRSVWRINTQPSFFKSHFATFPEKLVETPIKAGCPEFICKKCGKAREKIFKKEKINV